MHACYLLTYTYSAKSLARRPTKHIETADIIVSNQYNACRTWGNVMSICSSYRENIAYYMHSIFRYGFVVYTVKQTKSNPNILQQSLGGLRIMFCPQRPL